MHLAFITLRGLAMSERKVQPVSFSLNDPFEKELLEYAISKGFSKYVKRLIQRDKEGAAIQVPVHVELEDKPPKKGDAASFL